MSFFKKIFLSFTKRERVIFLAAAGIALLSFCVSMVMLIAETTTTVPATGGEYTEGTVGQPEYVNPVTASSESDLSIVKMVYSNVPDIADAVTSSPDGKTWTVRLKPNLHWQDGAQLTSDDVIFTVQSIQNPDAQSPLAASWNGIEVNRASELEVQFTLPAPYAFFGDNLKNLYIIPKHVFGDVPPGNWRLSDYNLKPVGSGPYQFASYHKNSDGFIDAYSLTAWKGSFTKQPLIPNFTFNFFRNESDLIKSFNSGTVDGFELASPSDIGAIARPYNLFSWRTTDYYAIFLNQSTNEALQDPAVRRALSLAIDRNDLIADALGGNGIPDNGPIPSDAAYASPDINDINISTSSLNLAATTLDAAGWKLGTNGERVKNVTTTAFPLDITITVPDIDFLVKTAEIIQNRWQSIGISTTITTDSPESIMDNVVNDRNYETLLFGNILGPSSDLYSFWDSSERFSPGLNLSTYSNPNVDGLIEAARTTMNDASRTEDFAEAENDIFVDAPALFLYSTNDLYAAGKNIQGIATGTLDDPSDYSREVPDWYLETTRTLK
jgi:peptide/nickel transport system substrate-binding protein